MGRSARHAPGDLRRINTIAVSRSRRAGGGPRADQGQAWDRVAAYQADLGAPSPTSALEDVYGRVESDLFRLVGELTPLPDQRGVIVAICGTVRGIDWFDKASTLKAYWPGLVQGYAVDALHTPNGEATMDDANALVAQVLAAETSTDNAFVSVEASRSPRMPWPAMRSSGQTPSCTSRHSRPVRPRPDPVPRGGSTAASGVDEGLGDPGLDPDPSSL